LYCCNLSLPQLSSTNLRRRRKRGAPAVSPLIGDEETPSYKVLPSRNGHQPRKAGSSPIRNIGRRSPPSIFNIGSGASATPPFRRPDPPPSSANTQRSGPPHSKSSLSPSPRYSATPDRSHSNSLGSTNLSQAPASPPTNRTLVGKSLPPAHQICLPPANYNSPATPIPAVMHYPWRIANSPALTVPTAGA
jgi:hypothetical protein